MDKNTDCPHSNRMGDILNKKFLTVFLVAVFLITSLGVISAAEDSDSISVKIVWDDNVNDKPDFVTVNLIKDEKIVNSIKLNKDNSWKTDFDVDSDGNYKVKEVISSDYSAKIEGNVKEGFVIKVKATEKEVLGASNSEEPLEESSSDEPQSIEATESGVVNADNSVAVDGDNSTGNGTGNGTDNSTDKNATDNATKTDDDGSDEKTTTTTKITKTVTKKVPKKAPKEVKKKHNDTEKLKKTGFPLVVLVAAVFVAMVVPFKRKK